MNSQLTPFPFRGPRSRYPVTQVAAPTSTTASANAAMDQLLAAGFANGQPFSASVKWSNSEIAVDFKLNGAQQPTPSANRPMIAAAPQPEPSPVLHARHPPSAPQVHVPKQYARPPPAAPTSMPVQPAAVSVPRPAVQQPGPRPSPPGNMVTLLSRVKWYDSAKGFGCAVPFEAGRPEVFLTQGDVQAAGISTLRGGMNVMVTFDATRPKPKALVLQLP